MAKDESALSSFSIQEIIRQEVLKQIADIARSSAVRPTPPRVMVLPLDNPPANPFPISQPFNSVFVRDATDSGVSVKLAFHSDEIQQLSNAVELRINDSHFYNTMVNKGFLLWEAQPGKTITIIFARDIEFRSGSQLSLNAGGLSINDGSAVTKVAIDVPYMSTFVLFPQNFNRKKALWRNTTGSAVHLMGVGAGPSDQGVPIEDGELFEYRNTAQLTAFSYVAANSHYIEME